MRQSITGRRTRILWTFTKLVKDIALLSHEHQDA
jgi:hypothetical protein